jgi:hypothetical protein
LEDFMGDTSNNKPSTADIDVLIGQAWSQHHHGQNEEAIQAFRQIVERWPVALAESSRSEARSRRALRQGSDAG